MSSNNDSSSNIKKYDDNQFAILGFVFSFFGFLSIIGLVLSIIGIISHKKYKNGRKVFAILGIIISCVSIVLSIIICNSFVDKPSNKENKSDEVCIYFYVDDEEYDKECDNKGKYISAPTNPTKEGYSFSHWATHINSIDGSEKVDITKPLDKNTTVYAHFDKNDSETLLEKNDENNTNSNSNINNNSNTNSKNSNNSNSNIVDSNNNKNTNNSSSNNNNNNNNETKPTETQVQVPESSGPTTSQTNAVRRARSYLDYMAFSRSGLISQLEYEGFSYDDSVYGVDNVGANWYNQAVKKARSYLDYMAFSRSGLISQLEYEGFANDQAVYGADNVGANWYDQAVKKAKSYLDIMAFSRDGLISQLEYEGFTNDQAVYGVTQNGL